MPWMQKEDGDPIMVDTKQVPHFDSQGYNFCPTPEHMKEAEPEVEAAKIVLKAGQVKMHKGDDYCICDAAQVEAFSAQGWSNEEGAAPEEESSDSATEGSNEDDENTLDQKQWEREDGDDIDPESNRL